MRRLPKRGVLPGTETARPDMRWTHEIPSGAFSVTVKVDGSFGLARGAVARSASRRVHSINPQPANGSTISSLTRKGVGDVYYVSL